MSARVKKNIGTLATFFVRIDYYDSDLAEFFDFIVYRRFDGIIVYGFVLRSGSNVRQIFRLD